MAGEDLNYYYLGHLMAAGLVKLSGVAPDVGYNLAVAAFFAFSVVAAFGLVAARWSAALARRPVGRRRCACWRARSAPGSSWSSDGGPLRTYDWFGASRVIEGTINEFPAFSFTLADLHGHVMAIPFSLLALAFGLQLALAGPAAAAARAGRARARRSPRSRSGRCTRSTRGRSRSSPGCSLLGALVRVRGAPSVRERVRTLSWGIAVLLLAVIAVLPVPAHLRRRRRRARPRHRARVVRHAGRATTARSTGCSPTSSRPPTRVRLARSRHPWRTAGWTAAAALFVGSLLARPTPRRGRRPASRSCWRGGARGLRPPARRRVERFVWVLIGGGLLCLLIPEVVYVKDSFDGSALYRMNTVFKLGYQAWLLLAIAGSAMIVWSWAWLGRRARLAPFAWGLPLLAGLALVAVYPVAGTYARKDGFSQSPHLGGLRWLEEAAPGDPPAIAWLRDHAPRGSVVLESVGDDYSAFGHARISTFTGLPTVMGWTGHELQWGHDPGTPPRRRRPALHDARRGGRAPRCSSATTCATSSSGRSSAPTTATPAWRSGTSSAAASSTATGRRCGELR